MNVHKNEWWKWPNFITEESRLNICKFVEENYETDEENSLYEKNKKFTKPAKLISWKKLKQLRGMTDIVDELYYTQAREFGFDIDLILENQFINYTVYDSDINAKYDWHKDSSNEAYIDVKCTAIINVSTEPYEGGQFEIFDGKDNIKLLTNPGDMIMFLSNQYHRVTPITKGVRKSLSFFLQGPKFK